MSFKIGKIYKINNKYIEVIHNDDIFSRPISTGNGLNIIGSLNSYVSIPLFNSLEGIGIIFEQYEPKKDSQELFESNEQKDVVVSKIRLIGTYNPFKKKFEKGLDYQPALGAEVFSLKEETLETIYQSIIGKDEPELKIGTDLNYQNISVKANPNTLLGKHFSIFGNTGTGKSCTVSSILQSIYLERGRLQNSSETSLKTIIIDSNDEYSEVLNGLNEDKIEKISVEDLRISHKNLTFYELTQLLEEDSPNVLHYLRSAILELKSTDNVDEQVYYDFAELPGEIISEIELQNNQNQWNFIKGYCGHLINRIEGFLSDSRYDCVFSTDENSIINFLRSDKQLLILSVQTANDVLAIIAYQICKTIYSYKRNNQTEDNLLLVLEEAHRYISEDNNDVINNYYVEKVAREGRKYGVNICVATQRPSDVSHTVISQCNSLIVHKLTNYRDLEFIRNTIEYEDRNQIDLISGLKQQEALVLGDAFMFSSIARISDADPIPKAETPKIF
ncbi:hypothetical protein SAMN05443144_1449 [Fodinibius roseus]|uniref:Helicase HerA central domain-containing protein n=1 Tax=Fodinibius roseus TaxID=1194090 RepID=A0A1M5LTK5_9BACT|nr:ATP-binding protein [Fodinibius roseus]SHG67703.1 hypothetical protein SAMN05443144_1449 [Fodinibius roseus]